jgi:hypothetical protein
LVPAPPLNASFPSGGSSGPALTIAGEENRLFLAALSRARP